MKNSFWISMLCLLAVSCSGDIFDDAEYADDIKLGAKVKSVECLSEYGECSFEVVANCTYSAHIVKGAEWLFFTHEESSVIEAEGNTILQMSYTSNRGYRRCALVVLSSGQRRDTLRVRQEGLYRQIVEADTDNLSVPGEGGDYSVNIRTNLIKKDFRFETVDTKDFPVIGRTDGCNFNDNVFSFRVFPSISRDEKTFIVRIYALDDWGEKVAADITITQEPGRK